MARTFAILLFSLLLVLVVSSCAQTHERVVECTGYCNCRKCCEWERGRWLYLKLDFWNRYTDEGKRYSGRTASGTKPHSYRPGLFSIDSVAHPWMIPIRTAFPWLILPRRGTLAADTRYYPFGTVIKIPNYGVGVVEDRGSAIQGPDRLDLYFSSHRQALRWGRQRVEVEIH